MDTDMDVATRNKKVKSVSIMLMDTDTDVATRNKKVMDMDTDTDVATRKKKVKGASIMLMDMDMDTMAGMPALTGITGMAMGPTNVQRPSPTLVAVLEYNAFPGLSFCASCSLHVN
jgi:hypothetical protein